MKLLSKQRLLLFSEKYFLYTRGVHLTCVDRHNDKIVYKGRFPLKNYILILLEKFSLMRRFLRLEARCGAFVNENSAIVSFHGCVYFVDILNKSISIEHKYEGAMNNPLSFACIDGINGFTDGWVYGEYTNDGIAKEVSIYRRSIDGKWEKAYSFPNGRVKHIHTILPSKERNSVLVFTGDNDYESGIWEFENDFSSIRSSFTGKQVYRACSAAIVNDDLVYVTDMPDYENYLFHIDLSKGVQSLNKIMRISGPSIYGKQLENGDLIFSTSVEGDSTNTSFFSWISYKLGNGVKDRFSHVYIGNAIDGFSEIATFKKDILPLKLFGYGNITFPQGNSNEIFVVGNSLCAISDKTIVLERK